MTISSSTNKVIYTANGVLTDFDFTFKTRNASDIQVYLDDVLQGSGYTVNLNADQEVSPGGTVVFDVAPADQTIVTIVREVPLTQEVDYQPYDPFPAETHEGALDKLTQIAQQQQEELDRATKASISDDGTTDYTLPLYDAGKGIMWDEVEKKLINSDDNLNNITTAAQQSADDSAVSAAAADASATDSANSASDSLAAADISASWAQKTDGIVEATDYSSKAYAIGGTDVTGLIGASKEWAITAEDTEVTPGEYSALHWAKKAEAAAATASPITTRGDVIRGDTNGDAERLALGASGSLLTSDGDDVIWRPKRVNAGAVATTSGTAIDFTGIPSWVTKITLVFDQVSLDAANPMLVQIGDSGGFETSTYQSSGAKIENGSVSAVGNAADGFYVAANVATYEVIGVMVIENIDGNTWVSAHTGYANSSTTLNGGGSKTLSGTLDRVRLTRATSGNFDNGQITLIYE